jgi:hypothetical protein
MSGKRMILTLPWSSSSEEPQKKDTCRELCQELEAKHKVCTGQRMFEQEPEKYNRVAEMLSQQLPIRDIAKECQVGFSTISSIRRHAGLSLETEKDALTETIRCAARVVAERVLELGEKMSPKEASVLLGILTDKLLVLQGEPNFIADNRSEHVLTHQEYNFIVESLPQANARVVNSESNAEGET